MSSHEQKDKIDKIDNITSSIENNVAEKEINETNDSDRTVFRKANAPTEGEQTVFSPKSNTPSTDQPHNISANIEQAQSATEHYDKTVFSPKTAPENKVTIEKENVSQAENPVDDKTVFSPRSPITAPSTLAQQIKADATRFSPRQPQSTSSPAKDTANIDQLLAGTPQTVNSSENVTSTANLKMLKERFVLEEVIGVGGMGVVYKAKDLLRVEAQDKDPYVAIKVLSDEFRTHPEAFISLQRESKKAQHIANQNTVKVYDFDRDNGVVFMTMEFMVGQPLDEMVKQYHATGLPHKDVFEILSGMCSALIHAHRENIVHSDLKPGNVFVTDNGVAKIFDFGIARAVAKIDRSATSEKDRTVFDAGNLGALTPAYASREMLLGQTPDVRDDIYALGCIAYEMLTGDHPFTRLPADEAYDKKLKPKRIQGIKKRHWKAIESALAFERKDRIASVAAFRELITEKKKTNYGLWFGLTLVLGAGALTYNEFFRVEEPAISQAELMNQMEFKIRYQLLQENIANLINTPNFTLEWQNELWEEMQDAKALFPEKPTPWFFTTRKNIYQLYLNQIEQQIKADDHTSALSLVENGQRYSDDLTVLAKYKQDLTQQIALKKQQLAKDKAAKDKLAEQQRIAQIKSQAAAKAKADKERSKQAVKAKRQENTNLYNLAMDNVESQLMCNGRINMRDFKVAIEKLRSLDNTRYLNAEPTITNQLSSCISKMAEISPDYARDAKRSALRLFRKNPELMALVIKDKDGCQLSIAGLGARGSRSLCKDPLKVGGTGPSLVVVPASGKIKAFAIGKYEVSINEYNVYCNNSPSCKVINSSNGRLPVTNISVKAMSNYLKWLSQNTGKKYRLPTKNEWTYAASAKGSRLDSNRNCKISSRGISKGKELVKSTTGKPNNWGLVNSAGNAQELVYIAGRKLEAVGGSFKTSMDICTSNTATAHTGNGDDHTGFRIVRNLVGN